ncbi:MAG: OsmC family protein [Candidatus Saganbacteria bacterium]|nr:OsmC family protein [Candidatus Saganbacteria bacterium]
MYKVKVKNNGGMVFTAKSEHGEIKIDAEGKAIEPLETLLAALGSCTGFYIRKYAQSANIRMDMFTLDLEAELAKGFPSYFKKIKMSIDLNGAVLSDLQKTAMMEFIKNCPVLNTLDNEPAVETVLL